MKLIKLPRLRRRRHPLLDTIIEDKHFFTLGVTAGLLSYMRLTLQCEIELLRLKETQLNTTVNIQAMAQ